MCSRAGFGWCVTYSHRYSKKKIHTVSQTGSVHSYTSCSATLEGSKNTQIVFGPMVQLYLRLLPLKWLTLLSFSATLPWILSHHAALLVFTNVFGHNGSNSDIFHKVSLLQKSFFGPQCIMWHCNSTVWLTHLFYRFNMAAQQGLLASIIIIILHFHFFSIPCQLPPQLLASTRVGYIRHVYTTSSLFLIIRLPPHQPNTLVSDTAISVLIERSYWCALPRPAGNHKDRLFEAMTRLPTMVWNWKKKKRIHKGVFARVCTGNKPSPKCIQLQHKVNKKPKCTDLTKKLHWAGLK